MGYAHLSSELQDTSADFHGIAAGKQGKVHMIVHLETL